MSAVVPSAPPRVAIVGAGVAGLVAAYRLGQRGCTVDVYERWPGLGGQAATLDVGQGHRLERYYHHWFTSDRHIVDLCGELGLEDDIAWVPSSMAFLRDGALWPFTTPKDLLRFKPLSLRDRIRMGLAVLNLQRRGGPVENFEHLTASEWVRTHMGAGPYDAVWGPLLRGKFGDRADDVSMAWLWGKFMTRRKLEGREAREELLGYPRSSFEPLFTALQARIEEQGGRVLIDAPVARLARDEQSFVVTAGAPGSFRTGHDPRGFAPAGEERYDAVIATVPSDVFAPMLDPSIAGALSPGYLEKLGAVEYHGALCLLLELDRTFSPYYWTNVADRDVPFVGLVEHTNLVPPEHYGGRRFLYVANYVAPGDPLLSLSADELLDRYEPGLRRANPAFSRDWIRATWLHREPAGQPVVTVGYHERIPPLHTGVDGLVLANTTQIYPEDRGTNYAVRLGEQAVAALAERIPVPA